MAGSVYLALGQIPIFQLEDYPWTGVEAEAEAVEAIAVNKAAAVVAREVVIEAAPAEGEEATLAEETGDEEATAAEAQIVVVLTGEHCRFCVAQNTRFGLQDI